MSNLIVWLIMLRARIVGDVAKYLRRKAEREIIRDLKKIGG